MHIRVGFYDFYKKYPYLKIQELIEYYSVFGGLEGFRIKPDDGLIENIKNIYLKNYEKQKSKYIYSKDEKLQSDIENALKRLSRGDRKRFSIYKDISQPQGKQIYKILFEKKIIKEEISREEPFRLNKKNIKKELRRYKIENKINFIQESTRFWFNFIAPNKKFIENGDFKKVIDEIKLHLEKHISLSFEYLSLELIKYILPKKSIISSGSFWSKACEIDLLVKTNDGLVIVGESKWKSRKICKNVLNSLQNKANYIDLNPTHFALFSKSGFSNEVTKLENSSLMLFSLKDFKRLLS